MKRTEEMKEEFYNQLQAVVSKQGAKDIMGDVNAKIGADNRGYEPVMGRHGLGTMNENGELRMKWCELREYKWNEYVTIAVNHNLSNCENSPKKSFSGLQRDSNPRPLRSRCSALPAWAMKTHTLRASQFIEFINPWKEWNTEWNDVNCGNTNEMSMWPSQWIAS